jgi:hypothetical protein
VLITLRQPETRNFDQAYVAARSDDACHLQPLKVHRVQAEAAEDLGVVLAELGRDRAHSHPLADLDRSADVRHLAPIRCRSRIARARGDAPAGRRTSARSHKPGRRAHRRPPALRPNDRCSWSSAPRSSPLPAHSGSPCAAGSSQNAGRRTIPGAPRPWHTGPRSPRRRHPPSDSRPWSACAGRAVLAMARALAGRLLTVGEPFAPRSTNRSRSRFPIASIRRGGPCRREDAGVDSQPFLTNTFLDGEL